MSLLCAILDFMEFCNIEITFYSPLPWIAGSLYFYWLYLPITLPGPSAKTGESHFLVADFTVFCYVCILLAGAGIYFPIHACFMQNFYSHSPVILENDRSIFVAEILLFRRENVLYFPYYEMISSDVINKGAGGRLEGDLFGGNDCLLSLSLLQWPTMPHFIRPCKPLSPAGNTMWCIFNADAKNRTSFASVAVKRVFVTMSHFQDWYD